MLYPDSESKHVTKETDELGDLLNDIEIETEIRNSLTPQSVTGRNIRGVPVSTNSIFDTKPSSQANPAGHESSSRFDLPHRDLETATGNPEGIGGGPRLVGDTSNRIDYKETSIGSNRPVGRPIMSHQAKALCSFFGAPEEDPLQWLERFEVLARANKWTATDKLDSVQTYIDGTARHWLVTARLDTWDEFRERFLKAFRSKHFKYTVEGRLKSRNQGSNEPVYAYHYAMIDLCRQLELQNNFKMSEQQKLEYLLKGLVPSLRSRVWPLVPYPIDTAEKFLEIASKHAEADEINLYYQDGEYDYGRTQKGSQGMTTRVVEKREDEVVTKQDFDKLVNQISQLTTAMARGSSDVRSTGAYGNYQP